MINLEEQYKYLYLAGRIVDDYTSIDHQFY